MSHLLLTNIDISIVTHNSLKWLPSFFKSLDEQHFPLNQIRLLIRDNQSTDGTYDWLQGERNNLTSKFLEVCLDQGGNIGFGCGHNENFKQLKSPYVLVTNVDLTFEQETLQTLWSCANRSESTVVSWECRQKPYEHPKVYNPITLETSWSSSACVLLRVSAIQEVGGYEPKIFLYGEDVELSYRLRDRGWILHYVPQAVVWHYSYKEEREIKPAQFLGSTLANVLLRCRYGTAQQIFAGFFLIFIFLLAKQKFPGQRFGLLRNIFQLFKLAPYFFRTRKRSRQNFKFSFMDYERIRDGAFYVPINDVAHTQTLVSVLVRTMPGRDRWLTEAVQSIANQTYPKIELVVVEDGGNSASAFIDNIKATGRFQNIIYKPLINKVGRCVAGNELLALATGELFCFLDDDDLFYADHLEVLVHELIDSPDLAGVYGLAFEVQTEVIRGDKGFSYQEKAYSVVFKQAFERAVLWHHNFMPIQTVLFRRSLYDAFGGFDLELDALEDWNLWVRYTQERPFRLIQKVTSLYRVPANAQVALSRQQSLDHYYALAVDKNAAIKMTLSPAEILKISEVMARESYFTGISKREIRKRLMRFPLLVKVLTFIYRQIILK